MFDYASNLLQRKDCYTMHNSIFPMVFNMFAGCLLESCIYCFAPFPSYTAGRNQKDFLSDPLLLEDPRLTNDNSVKSSCLD